MKKILLLSITLILLLGSCSKDVDLENSIFIPDEDYPELPAYSEWGYNTFGVKHNNSWIISSPEFVPLKVVVEDSICQFIFTGRKRNYNNSYYNQDRAEVKIILEMPIFSSNKYEDLLVLNDSIIDLTNPNIKMIYQDGNNIPSIEISEGQFHFKKVQNLYIDGEKSNIILSGTFRFKGKFNGKASSFNHGRFDIGLAWENYYFF